MKSIGFFENIFCSIILGLLCGWYYLLMIIYPFLIYYSIFGNLYAILILTILIVLTISPIKHDPIESFMYHPIWKVLRDYFDYEFDCSSISGENKLDPNEKYLFTEFPHGIFPMGQFLSASLIREIAPDQMICGTGANIIFYFPVMRQIMAWIGTHKASRSNITKILNKFGRCAIIPGGIAEMYLVNDETEKIFLLKRKATIKAAIEEGAHIVPAFFFGNSSLFHVVGGGKDSYLSKISRKMRTSIVFFYGRFFLPIPLRKPLKMITGDIIKVKKISNPTDADIEEVLNRLVISINNLYQNKRPDWETRPLVIE